MRSQTDTATAVRVALLSLATVVMVAALAGCGGSSSTNGSTRPSGSGDPPADAALHQGAPVEWLIAPRPIHGVRQRTVGHGARAAVVLWGRGGPPSRDVVVFLHGWRPMPPWTYGPWLRHLIRDGNTVVYPVCQGISTRPEAVRDDALAGIAAGLRAAHARSGSIVAIGHTTGGVLAFDYAALAAVKGLPAPRGVFAVYPGRRPPGGEITSADLAAIPASTRLAVIAGPGDPIPGGDAEARALLARSTQVPSRSRAFLGASYRGSPGSSPSAAPRHSFWAPADRLIVAARAGRPSS